MSEKISSAPGLRTFFEDLLGFAKAPARRPKHFAGRAEKSIGQFVLEAKQNGVSLRVAREAYDLLRHHYPRPMCVELGDHLGRDLRMSLAEVSSIRAGLLSRTDRLQRDDAGELLTVRQLLESVEAAPKNGVDRAVLRERVSDRPVHARPVVENLPFTEQSSLADPDFMRRAHFKWLRRRNADYKGFRSRVDDHRPPQDHPGPFRRGAELTQLALSQNAGHLARIAAEKQTAVEKKYSSMTPDLAVRSEAASRASRPMSPAHQGY